VGGVLFTMVFTREVGFGAADLPPTSRFHRGRRGGPDAMRCADCHWRGGLAGAGDAADNAFFRGDGVTEASTLQRNPPPLPGLGLVEMLGAEMSEELQAQRDELQAFARARGYAVRVPLHAKGIAFGFLTAAPDGAIDYAELEGVDDDLVVKPFGWKGTFATIRDVVEDALLVHHGMQSEVLVEQRERERVGDGPEDDPDGDGVVDEIGEGQVSALTLFVAMQEVPQELPPVEIDFVTAYARGRKAFEDLGCAGCHTPSLPLDDAVFELPARISDGQPLAVDMFAEAAAPRLSGADVRLYSDLKRHHMGAALAETRSDAGVDADVFLTRPLWGIARSRPYLHDGRAPTLEDAILLHGGEAQASRDAFAALSDAERAPLRVFLGSLTRAERLVAP
jgi:mono/diheme cytochrome c family protein